MNASRRLPVLNACSPQSLKYISPRVSDFPRSWNPARWERPKACYSAHWFIGRHEKSSALFWPRSTPTRPPPPVATAQNDTVALVCVRKRTDSGLHDKSGFLLFVRARLKRHFCPDSQPVQRVGGGCLFTRQSLGQAEKDGQSRRTKISSETCTHQVIFVKIHARSHITCIDMGQLPGNDHDCGY